ncbi:hypothetical protein QR680_005346 [Steinernema hermaphroditum]|uniref:Uncharacterized protein n=1 Tax=Steinernema hermaphroditum TaxID=289476 RepID=A0AA39LVH5_9BILA|nr:hypothetical protein QR680_005346 [Steinernema hermaphroditum]
MEAVIARRLQTIRALNLFCSVPEFFTVWLKTLLFCSFTHFPPSPEMPLWTKEVNNFSERKHSKNDKSSKLTSESLGKSRRESEESTKSAQDQQKTPSLLADYCSAHNGLYTHF